MGKIKLTIQELKRQQSVLKRYQRYLPTLTLKKLQIQIELNRAKETLEKKAKEEEGLREGIRSWVAVMGEDTGIRKIVQIEEVEK